MTESSVGFSRKPVSEEGEIRVLHVDDEPSFLKVTSNMLEMRGNFQVETAFSVKEAIRKLEAESFDAVVSDYPMSGQDGLLFLKELRDQGNRIPFIMFTGKGKEEVAMRALNLGADRYLQKHGDPETVYGELAHSIRRAVKSRRMKEELRQSEKKYRLLAENTTDVIFIEDMNLNIRYASPSAEPLFGYTPEEMLELKKEEFMTPESYQKAVNSFRNAAQMAEENPNFKVPLMQYEYVRRDGSTFWGELKVKFLRDRKDLLRGVQGTLRDISSRKETAERLRESEKRYRNFFKTTKGCAFITSKDGRWIDMSDSAPEFFGYNNKEELKKVKIPHLYLNPGDRKEHLQKIEEKGFLKNYPLDLKKKDGTVIHTLITSIPVENEKGQVTGYQGMIQDITERRKVEKQLKESEEKYRLLAEHSADVIYTLNLEKEEYEYVSPSVENVLGYTPQEALSMTPRDVLTPESYQKQSRVLEKDLSTGRPSRTLQLQAIHKDGTVFPVEIHATFIPNENGKPVKILGVVRDVTERVEWEEKIQKERKRFQEIFNNANDAIYLHELTDEGMPDRFIEVNDVACQMLGYSREELLEMTPQDIDSSPKAEEVPEIMEELLDKGDTRFEMVHQAKDGTPIPVEIHSHLFELEGKQRILSIARDITQRKQREQVLVRSLGRLAMLNEKLEVVGKMTRHDVRNKLSTVATNLYLAKRQLQDQPGVEEYLEEVELAVEQATKIFDFAKAYEQLGTQEPEPVDVGRAVEDALQHISDLKGVEIVNECRGFTVVADQMLPRLFYNLIHNSLQHGGKKVSRIRVYHQETEEDEVKVVYEDDGIGVPQEEKEKIFHEGYGDDTGYGLYLIRKMCEVYGWTIQENGIPGQGAQFTITIPKTNRTKN